jgi:apolipoprotein N-acyltransferase
MRRKLSIFRSYFLTAGGRVLLVAVSLLLSLLSLPGGALPLVALVSLVPLGLALHGARRAECFAYAYTCGLLGWLAATGDLAAALSAYAHVSHAAAWLLLTFACAWLAVPYGVFGLLYGTFQWLKRPRGALKTAACLALLVSLCPSPLPLDSAHALYRFPLLAQMLDVGGRPLLLFTLYLFNWLLVDLVLRLRRRGDYKVGALWLVLIVVLVVGYGRVRLAQSHGAEATRTPGRTLRVAIIQPNLPLAGDSDPHSTDALNPFQALLEQSEAALSVDHSIELVVWPETPTRLACADDMGVRPQLTQIVARYGVPFLVNCAQPAQSGGDYNTELLLTPRGVISAYHKQRLFPFTEYVPGEWWLPGVRSFIPNASRYVAGQEATVFRVKEEVGVFSAICYEILFPDQSRAFVAQGGNVLISAANDAWFGASRIPEFEIAAGVYQAIQYRVPVIRVANSGDSVAVKASGEIVPGSRTHAFTRTTRVVEVFVPTARAPYFYLGHAFLYLLACGWTLSMLNDLYRRRKDRVDPGASGTRFDFATRATLRPIYDE